MIDIAKQLDTIVMAGLLERDADDNVFSETNDFRGFVEETGAENLQELLEASAAFATFIEDQGNNGRLAVKRRKVLIA